MRSQYCIKVAAMAAIMAGLGWGLPVLAAEPKLIDVLGPTKLTMPLGKTSEETASLEVPVRLLKTVANITLQTANVSLGGTALAPAVFTFELKPQGNQGLANLIVNIDRRQADQTGEYTVTLLAWLKTAPSAEQPRASPPKDNSQAQPPGDKPTVQSPGGKGKAAPPADKPQDKAAGGQDPEPEPQKLTFTFTKPAAKLQLMPTRLERIIYIPWLWSGLSPDKLLLSETGGESNLSPYERQWFYELTLKDGQPLPAKLVVSDLKPLAAWKQENAQVNVEGCLPLGSAKGAVSIRAPELASHQAVFNIDVVSRTSLAWLWIILVCSIGLGWGFREYLEKRKEQTEAEIAAQEQLGVVLELISKTADEKFKNDLMAVKDRLASAIKQKGIKAADLKTAADTAKQTTEGILKEATTKHDNLDGKISQWLAVLRIQDQAPAVAEAISRAANWLKEQQSHLAAGLITRVETGFESGKPDFLDNIHRNLENWLKDVEWALKKKRPWPENDYDPELTLISQDVATIKGQISDNAEPNKLRKLLLDTRNLYLDLKGTLFERRGKEIKDDAQTILNKMKQLYPDPMNIYLNELEGAISSYIDELEAENRPENLLKLMEGESRLWDSLKKVLGKGYQLETKKTEELPLLGEGKFTDAYNVIRTARQEALQRKLGEEVKLAPEELITRVAAKEAKKEPESLPPVWLIAIKKPEEAVAGEPVSLELSVSTPGGQPSPNLVVRWSVAGDARLRKQGLPGELLWQFTPPQAGTLFVLAEAELLETGEKRQTQAEVRVLEARGFPAAAELKKRLQVSERIQSGVSLLILSVIGYAIFRVSFVGTLDDVIAVGLWGFTLDIGVAKIREYAKPLQQMGFKYPGKS